MAHTKQKYLDHLGERSDVEHVEGVLYMQNYNGGMIDYKGEKFSPKVCPTLYYMAYFSHN